MKKKLLSKTYLRDVQKYNLSLFIEDDFYVVVKKIIETNPKFIARDGKVLIDNGYYIVEVIPKNENYAMRIFLDKNKNPIEYYFDITQENGFDKDTNIPYFYDLYVDIIEYNGNIYVVDENELEEAYKNDDISIEEYRLAGAVKKKLYLELKNKTNGIRNLNIENYLE